MSEVIGGVSVIIEGDYSGLQSDFDAAQALAASAASKIADALDFAAPDTAPVTAALQQVSDAATATGQSIATALDVQIAAPDVSTVVDSFAALSDSATASASAIAGAFSGDALPAPDTSAIIDGFTAIDTAAQQAADTIAQDFSAMAIPAPDISGFTGALSLADEDLGKLEADFLALEGSTSGAAAAFTGVADAIGQETTSALDGQAALQAIIQQLTDGEISGKEFVTMSNALANALEAVGAEAPAVAAGLSSISEAATAAAVGEKAFSDAAQAIIDEQAKLDSELSTAQGALAEIRDAYASGAISAETLARAENEVQSAFSAANPAIEESGKAADGAKESFSALNSVLGAVGIALSVGAFVSFAESIGEVSDSINRATISLTALTGDAEKAKSTLEGLEQIGMSDGLSMPSLLQAATSMQNLLPAGTDVVGVLSQIADGAAIMGKSVDAAVSAFDRIVDSGKVSDKTLSSMGLNMDKLKEGMEEAGVAAGILADGTKKAFAELDQHDRIAVMQTALQQFQGVAEDIANNTFAGVWHQAIAQWDADINKIKTDLGPLTDSVLPNLKALVNDVAAAFVAAFGVINYAVTSIVGNIVALQTQLVGLATASKDALSGNFAQAGKDISDAFANASAVMTKTKDDMAANWAASQKTIQDLMTQTATSVTPVITALDNLGGHAKDTASKIADALAAVQSFDNKVTAGGGVAALQAAFENASKAINIVAKNDLPEAIKAVDDYTAAQVRNGASASVIMQAFQDESKLIGQLAKIDLPDAVSAMNKLVAEFSAAKEPLGIVQAAFEQEEKLIAQLAKEDFPAASAAWDKLIQTLKETGAPLSILNQALQDHQKFLDAAAKSAEAAAAAMDKAALAYAKFNLQGPAATQAIKDAAAALDNLGIMAAKAPAAIDPVNQAMIDFGVSAGKLKDAVQNLHTPIEQLTTDMGNLIAKAQQTGDWSPILTALDTFDKRISFIAKTDLPEAASELEAMTQKLINMHAPTDLVVGQMNQLEPILKKMADEDVPGATAAWQKYLDLLKQVPAAIKDIQQGDTETLQQNQQILASMQARGDAYGYILTQQQKVLQEEIAIAEKTGADANDQVLGLEKVKLATEELRLESHGLADQEVAMIGDILKGFDQMGQAMAGAIVNGKNLGDALVGEFKKIGQSILGDLINAALIPLKLALFELIGSLLPGMSGAMSIVGGGLGAMNTAAGTAATGLTALATAAQTAAANINASVGGAGDVSSAGGGLTSAIGAVSAVVSAGAAVASAILLAHISSDTGHIEVNTRSCLAELENRRQDAWDQYNGMYQRIGEILNAVQGVEEKLSHLTVSATAAALTPAESKALESAGDNAPLIFSELVAIQSNTQYALAALQNISGELDVAFGGNSIYDMLAVINASILTVVSAINYGTQSGKSYSEQATEAAQAVAEDVQNGAMSAHADLSRVDTSIQEATSSGRTNTQLTVDQQIAKRQDDIATAQAAANDARNIADRVDALRSEYSADIAAMNDALRAGNVDLATQYQHAAAAVQEQITPLLSSTATNTGNTATYVEAAGNQTAFAAQGAGVLVSAAVQQSAATISQAVMAGAVASASLFNTGLSSLSSIIGAFGRAGGGLPGGQTGLPSGSGLGNANPNGTPTYANPGIPIGEQPGFNPNPPATGGMTQAQWEATGQ